MSTIEVISYFIYTAVAASFLSRVKKRIKKGLSLEYFMRSKFLEYRKKIRHVQCQRPSIMCAYRVKGFILIEVRTQMIFFPLEMKICPFHISMHILFYLSFYHYTLNFKFPFTIKKVSNFR